MKNGFTLMELLAVVLIIGILAAVALPEYRVAVEKARVSRALILFKNITRAMDAYYLANGFYSADVDDLDISFEYESKTAATYTRPDSGYRDEVVRYFGTPVGNFTVSSSFRCIWFATAAGYTIDFCDKNGSLGKCYSAQASSVGERVCKSFGPKAGTSAVGTNLYLLSY